MYYNNVPSANRRMITMALLKIRASVGNLEATLFDRFSTAAEPHQFLTRRNDLTNTRVRMATNRARYQVESQVVPLHLRATVTRHDDLRGQVLPLDRALCPARWHEDCNSWRTT